MEVRATIPSDFDGFEPIEDVKLAYSDEYICATMLSGGKPLIIGGIKEVGDLGLVTLMISKDVKRTRLIYETAKKGLCELMRQSKSKRFIALIQKDFTIGKRFASVFGFSDTGKEASNELYDCHIYEYRVG